MKKKLFAFLLILTVVILASSCNSESSSKLPTNVNQNIFLAISSDPDFNVGNNYGLIDVITVNLPAHENDFLVKIRQDSRWTNDLWMINYINGVITKKVKINVLDGELVKLSTIQISQGDFIEAYFSTNKGNGGMVLVDLNNLSRISYEFPGVVDKNQENSTSIEFINNYRLPLGTYSSIIIGDYLEARYEDINNDGNTDIVFSGIKEIISEKKQKPLIVIYVEQYYVYSNNKFILDHAISKSEVLTLGDGATQAS